MSSEEDFAMIKGKFLDKNIRNIQDSLKLDMPQKNNLFGLCESFKDFKEHINSHMEEKILDRHKISAAIALSVLQFRVFERPDNVLKNLNSGQVYPKGFYLANERLALDTSLDVLKAFMLKNISNDYNIPVHTLLEMNLKWKFPELLRDKGDSYLSLLGTFYFLYEDIKANLEQNFQCEACNNKFIWTDQHIKNNLMHSALILCHLFYYIEIYNKNLIISNIESLAS